MANPIRFFGHDETKPWWRFSNFALMEVVIDNVTYMTTEHYFQAAKFFKTDPEYSEEITNAATPKKAKDLGKSRKHPIDPEWETIKDDVMRIALWSKAFQHPEFVKDLR